MNTIAFIFARKGSKGLVNKNIRSFCGQPLIAWSILQALNSDRISRVIVSTDSEEIAQISKEYGAEVPFIRPNELAQDDSPEWLAWRHALNFIKASEGTMPDFMLSLPATAPLRQKIDIENCLDEFQRGDADAVVTVTDAHRNPYFNMVKAQLDGTVSLVMQPNSNIVRRQDAPAIFDMTTVAYVVKSSLVLNRSGIFEGRIRTVFVPKHRAIDIDDLYDFQIAEFLKSVELKGKDTC